MRAALFERLFYCPPLSGLFIFGGSIRLQHPTFSTGVHMNDLKSYIDLLNDIVKFITSVLSVVELLKKLFKRK